MQLTVNRIATENETRVNKRSLKSASFLFGALTLAFSGPVSALDVTLTPSVPALAPVGSVVHICREHQQRLVRYALVSFPRAHFGSNFHVIRDFGPASALLDWACFVKARTKLK